MEKVKIGICDNEILQVEYLERLVENFFTERNIDHKIICSTNSKGLLEHANLYNIVFLDVDMDDYDIDGVEIGKQLRKENKKAHIIYVTGYQEYMYSAQKTHFFHYVLKPIDVDELFRILYEVMEYLNDDDIIIPFLSVDGRIDLKLNDIICFELKSSIVVLTIKKKYELISNMDALEKIFKKYSFKYANRYCAVNLENVKKIKNELVIMNNNEEIDVSKRRLKNFKESYINFLVNKI